jgi:hypothetical protein
MLLGSTHDDFDQGVGRAKGCAHAGTRWRIGWVDPVLPDFIHFRLGRHVCQINRGCQQLRLARAGRGEILVDLRQDLPRLFLYVRRAVVGGEAADVDYAVVLDDPTHDRTRSGTFDIH